MPRKKADEAEIPKDFLPFITWKQVFYHQQKEFIRSLKWLRAFIAANGTGKSLLLHWNLVAYGIGLHPHQNPDMEKLGFARFPDPPLRIRILVPDFDKVHEVSLPKLLNPQIVKLPEGRGEIEVGPMLPKSMIKPKSRFTKDHRQIDLKNGTVFSWVTNEQGWKAMRGAEFDILGEDEESDERVHDENIRGLRNAKGGGKILIGLTPPYEEGQGPTWTKERILEASETDPDIDVFKACMADNPAITKEYIERFSRGKTKEMIQVQVYGQYPTWGDVIHPDFQDTFWDPKTMTGHLLPDSTPMPDDYDVDWVMAFDWHPSKPAAALWGYVERDGNVTIFDELDPHLADRAGDDIEELADIFRNIEGFPHRKRKFRRWQDPSAHTEYKRVKKGWNAWDAFRKAGIVTGIGRNRDPNVGIGIVNDYFRGNGKDHPRLFIYERCKNLRKYLSNHYWVKGSDGVGKPDPKWSDFTICLRYILQEIGWKHKKRKKQKKEWPVVSWYPKRRDRNIIDLGRHI